MSVSESVPTARLLFQSGFRPLFLLAAACAALLMPAWLLMLWGQLPLPGAWAGAWHGHEMVFGFAFSAIAGFLLTAVPKWTESVPQRGVPLLVLASLLFGGRCAALWADRIPSGFHLALDLAPIALVLWLIAPPIYRGKRRRNDAFPVLLLLLMAAEVAAHVGTAQLRPELRSLGLRGAVFTVCLMVAVVGGRITPAFTANALRKLGCAAQVRTRPRLGLLGHLLMGGSFALELFGAPGPAASALAWAAAGALVIRVGGWQGHRTLRDPLLWSLHLGHVFLVLAMVFRGLAGHVPAAAALHAITAGAIGTMVIAVMSRASLGHTGRPLVVGGVVAASFGLVVVGALLRVVGTFIPGDFHVVTAGGALWALGFCLFALRYGPILTAPRVDGLPG